MKRRVYHLAKKSGIAPEDALARLQAAGFSSKTVNDQVSAHAVDSALSILGMRFTPERATTVIQPVIAPARKPEPYRSTGNQSDTQQRPPIRPFRAVPLPPPAKRKDKQHTVHYLETGYLLDIHNALVEMFAQENDPIFPPGPKDEGLLDSAAHRMAGSDLANSFRINGMTAVGGPEKGV